MNVDLFSFALRIAQRLFDNGYLSDSEVLDVANSILYILNEMESVVRQEFLDKLSNKN